MYRTVKKFCFLPLAVGHERFERGSRTTTLDSGHCLCLRRPEFKGSANGPRVARESQQSFDEGLHLRPSALTFETGQFGRGTPIGVWG